jgi:UDP:flavonoid glycosyltransferase YjiC (YdhE family)
MRILYGVTGEGMGHATRSKVVCEHLVRQGHAVKIVVSGRAHSFLSKSFPDVVEIKGLTLRYVDNAMAKGGSLAQNLLAAPSLLYENVNAYYEKVIAFDPHAVITDFDSFAYLFGKLDYRLTKAFVRAKLPGCEHYLITTFFYPKVRKKCLDTTTLVPSILRRAILDAKKRARLGDHVLVYQTSTSDKRLIPTLNKVQKERFVVYGLRRNAVEGNCVIKDFSEEGFVEDLAQARAVVTNGGLSLIGEALYLGKPVYSVPVQHQFEQLMNARYLEGLGYGLSADVVDPDVLRLFLTENAKYAERVRKHAQDGNTILFSAVDDVLRGFAKRQKKRRRADAHA